MYFDNCLLRFSFSALRWATMRRTDQFVQQISIGKIAFGHNSKPLLFFTQDVRSSISPGAPLLQDDLIVIISPGVPSGRIDIRLKPVHVILDLVQLDDILSRSGGLSSILELGNSIVSTSTIRGGSPPPKSLHTRQRSVRFESAAQTSSGTEATPTMSDKIDLRLGGLSVDLLGSEAAMQVKTSVIKLVYRQ